MMEAVALIHGVAGAYGISFPDFDGCVSGGTSIDECLRRGKETLAFHLESMAEVGEQLPRLRALDEIKQDAALQDDLSDNVLAAVIEVTLPEKSVRVDIAIDERLLEPLDKRAAEQGETRDAPISKAARAVLA